MVGNGKELLLKKKKTTKHLNKLLMRYRNPPED